jgi:hypothetical protein
MAPVLVISGVKVSTNRQQKVGAPEGPRCCEAVFVLAHWAPGDPGRRFFSAGAGSLLRAKTDAQLTALARPFPPSPDDANNPRTMGGPRAREIFCTPAKEGPGHIWKGSPR